MNRIIRRACSSEFRLDVAVAYEAHFFGEGTVGAEEGAVEAGEGRGLELCGREGEGAGGTHGMGGRSWAEASLSLRGAWETDVARRAMVASIVVNGTVKSKSTSDDGWMVERYHP